MKYLVFILAVFTMACQPGSSQPEETQAEKAPYIVFVTGDEEYRSEESMPMLARILKEDGFRVKVCYSIDSAGYIDPNNLFHINGLESLDSADMMVVFTRFRELPANELEYISRFAESGKPMVGFRTATHAFRYKQDTTQRYYNEEWPIKVFGQKWITHHGHFKDGEGHLTDVNLIDEKSSHPVMRGVSAFKAYSWLYHVDGGDFELYGDSDPLLIGTSLKSNHEMNNRLDKFPLNNPVAWTKTYTGESGNAARVFFTTLGHPFDFKAESMRKLALNGIYWAMGMEDKIPAEGIDATIIGTYDPNNSGFGQEFKLNQKPPKI